MTSAKIPQVSVLVPVYNGAKFLGQCLESILAQDFADMEILISDDGSKDDSAKIIQDAAKRDARISWWTNPANQGLTGNSNVCLRAARGHYIKFVHQDDVLLSRQAVAKLAHALGTHPAASLAACKQHLTGSKARPLHFSQQAGCFDGRKVIIASLEQNTNLIGQPVLTLFRRAQAQRGFDPRFTGFLDFEMWCHLLEQGDFVFVPEGLASWRVHQEQQTARTQASATPELDHLRFMEIYFAKPWLRAAATDRLLFTQIYYLRKHYGAAAKSVTDEMAGRLSSPRMAQQWLRHKISRPLDKLARKLTGQ